MIRWSTLDLSILIGRWMLLHNHHGNWRGYVEKAEVSDFHEWLRLEIRDLQFQEGTGLFYRHPGPVPRISIEQGALSYHHRDIHWHSLGVHLILSPPRDLPRKGDEFTAPPRRADPVHLRSSGGTRLRRLL